jgi:hypothetical protein
VTSYEPDAVQDDTQDDVVDQDQGVMSADDVVQPVASEPSVLDEVAATLDDVDARLRTLDV